MAHYDRFDDFLAAVSGTTETIELTNYKETKKPVKKKKNRKEADDGVQAD